MRFKIAHTHRGPVIDFKTLRFNTLTLYGVKNPDFDVNSLYSLGWAKNEVDDQMFKTIFSFWNAKDVHEVLAYFDEESFYQCIFFSGTVFFHIIQIVCSNFEH